MSICNPSIDDNEKRNLLKQFVYEQVVDGIHDFEEVQEKLVQEFKQIKEDREALRSYIIKTDSSGIHLPVHIPRMIQFAKEKFDIKARGKSDLQPGYVFD